MSNSYTKLRPKRKLMMVCYVLTIIYITLYLAVLYLVKFLNDGVVSMKSGDDLEHVKVPPDSRMSFLIGDIVNTEWELDGEMYEAEIIEVWSKLLNSCIYICSCFSICGKSSIWLLHYTQQRHHCK